MPKPKLPRDEKGNIIREPVVISSETKVVAEVSKELPIQLFADVYINGQLNRTYSYEIHGEKFEELSHEFADQHKGSEVRMR
jgi:hypothetical protein